MATTMASRQRSTAISSTSGFASAVSAVNLPLPQPTSTQRAVQSGFRERQLPFMAAGSAIRSSPQRSIRLSRFFILRILILYSSNGISHILSIYHYSRYAYFRQRKSGEDRILFVDFQIFLCYHILVIILWGSSERGSPRSVSTVRSLTWHASNRQTHVRLGCAWSGCPRFACARLCCGQFFCCPVLPGSRWDRISKKEKVL